jgi:hypothetical protein
MYNIPIARSLDFCLTVSHAQGELVCLNKVVFRDMVGRGLRHENLEGYNKLGYQLFISSVENEEEKIPLINAEKKIDFPGKERVRFIVNKLAKTIADTF